MYRNIIIVFICLLLINTQILAADYYRDLGVERDASYESIKRAYQHLARIWHPDRNNSPDAESRMKVINEAYKILKSPRSRTHYDLFGANGSTQHNRYSYSELWRIKVQSLVHEHPDWKSFFENLQHEVPKAIIENKFDFLAEVIFAMNEVEFAKFICERVGAILSLTQAKKFILNLVEHDLVLLDKIIIEEFLSKAGAFEMEYITIKLIRRFIQKNDMDSLLLLVTKVFSKAHAQNWTDSIIEVIKYSDPKVLYALVDSIPTISKYENEIRQRILALVNSVDSGALPILSRLLSHPIGAKLRDIAIILIDKGDPALMAGIAYYTLPAKHFIQDRELILYFLNRSHVGNGFVFNTKNIMAFLREKVLSQPYWQSPQGEILRKATLITGRDDQTNFLKQQRIINSDAMLCRSYFK